MNCFKQLNLKAGFTKKALRGFLFLLSILFSSVSNLYSQPKLDRISITERSDHLGYVIRFHLSAPVDSSSFACPKPGLVQVALWKTGIDTTDYVHLSENNVVEKTNIFGLEDGIGFEFVLNETRLFEMDSYLDVNGKDILLSLENIQGNTENFSANVSRINWVDYGYQQKSISKVEENKVNPDIQNQIKEPADKVESFDHSYDTIDRSDPMYVYLRGIYYLTDDRSEFSSIPVDSSTLQIKSTSHPWYSHPYFNSTNLNSNGNSIRFFAPQIFFSNNSRIPMGFNDGALWQGKGSNASASFGVNYQNDYMLVTLHPIFVYSQNLEFRLNPYPQYEGLSPYAESLSNVDLPQRFGDKSIQSFDWGDSSIEFRYKSGVIGLSNKRMWWGPAIYNPLMLSNNAPGFKHVFIGTSKPLQFTFGEVESRIFWGGLEESDYFDENPHNNLRYVSGFYLSYSPPFLKNLEAGFIKTSYSYYPKDGFDLADVGMVFRLPKPPPNLETAGLEKTFYMSMASVFARWKFPSAGFEVYFEWGRDDYKRKLRDYIAEPELNRGYVFGFLKNYGLGSIRRLLFQIELTNLENSSVTSQKRDNNIWYENDVIRQGFTQQGQVLGASIGPGSSTQMIRLSYYDKWGMVGAYLRRIAHNNDRHFEHEDYFRSFARYPEYFFLLDRHEIELRYGFEALVFLPYNLELSAQFYRGNIDNRYNQRLVDLSNDHFSLSLRYYFSDMLR